MVVVVIGGEGIMKVGGASEEGKDDECVGGKKEVRKVTIMARGGLWKKDNEKKDEGNNGENKGKERHLGKK